MNSVAANVTGDGTIYTVSFGTEIFDQGGDFSSTTFTAPVTGKYLLSSQITFNNLTAAITEISIGIVTSNRIYYLYENPPGIAQTYRPYALSVLTDMDAGDTAVVRAFVNGTTKTIDLYGENTNIYSYFSGSLIN
jgi:hypothetical protein